MRLELHGAVPCIEWLPAERLGQKSVDTNVRSWLIGHGMLSARMRTTCAERFNLRLVSQCSGLLTGSQKSALRTGDNAGLFRDVEMGRDEQVWVFAQTIVPDSTLSRHRWLVELGDAALDETLDGLSGVERSSYEYAFIPDHDPLAARALRGADIKPPGLWARRTRVALRGSPLLMQEVFFPSAGLV